MREALQAYVKRIAELAGYLRGNEQATKWSAEGNGSTAAEVAIASVAANSGEPAPKPFAG